MSDEKKAKDLMIALEDYPHIPYWFSLRQAMAIIREATIKFEGQFEPRAVLVFDEKYRLVGVLTLRDIIRGLKPKFLEGSAGLETEPDLPAVIADFFGPGLQAACQKPVSEVMKPFNLTIQGNDPITKALYLMIKENVGRIPVIQDDKVVGMIRISDLFTEISELVLGDERVT